MHPKVSHNLYKKDMLLKHQEEQQRVRQLQEKAMNEAQKLSRILIDEFGVERVFLAGPLIYGKFREGMSLELAVEAIPNGLYGSALGHLKRISLFGVELIDLRTTDSWTKRSIETKGKLLAEKEGILGAF